MSIATLKRKTQAKYNNMSVGQKTFSLNGTHRSQGYVGQTSLSRSLPRTLMNGPTPRGYGGCCGKYPILGIVQSAVTSLNDPTVVKNSVITTHGMIEEKTHGIANINETYFETCDSNLKCYNTVKSDYNQHLNDQTDFIKNKAKKAIKTSNLPCNAHQYKDKSCDTGCTIGKTHFTHAKPKSDYVAISQGENIINKSNICIQNDIIAVPKKTLKTPFGC